MIRVKEENTVKSLRDKLQALIISGNHDSGFPIVREDDVGLRMVGYIGANELEHALSTYLRKMLHQNDVDISQVLSPTTPTSSLRSMPPRPTDTPMRWLPHTLLRQTSARLTASTLSTSAITWIR